MLTGGLAVTTMPAFAQDAALEEITVTGSRIPRRDFVANAPITTVDAGMFEQTNAIGVETVLNQLPQFVPAVTQFDTQDVENNATNTVGASTVSLRGLGPNRNLVLIDGRRAQPVNPTMVVDTNSIPSSAIARVEVISGGASAVYGADAVGGVVNFILKDDFEGASIDARIADTQHGGSQEVTLSALVGASLGDNRGNVMLGIERATRSKQYLWERDWRVADYANPSVVGTAYFATETYFTNPQGTIPNSNNPQRAVVDGIFSGAAPGAIPLNSAFFINRTPNGTGTTFTGLGAIGTNAAGAPGAYRYEGPLNEDPYGNFEGLPFRKVMPDGRITENTLHQWASTPLERFSAFGRGKYEVADNIRVTSMATFARTETATNWGITSDAIGTWGARIPFGTGLYAPSVVDAVGNDGIANTGDENLNTLPAYLSGGVYGLNCPAMGGCSKNQAFPLPQEIVNIFMSRPDPEMDIQLNRPLDFFREQHNASRETENDTTTMQLMIGVEGESPSGDHLWDVSFTTGRTTTAVGIGGAVRLESWRRLVSSPNFGVAFQGQGNPTANGFSTGISSCATGVPVVRTFEPSQDCIEMMAADMQNTTKLSQNVFEANLVGDLAEMSAGPLQYALGTSVRDASYKYTTDNLTRNEALMEQAMGFWPTANSAGEFDVSELYGELLIPIVSNGPKGVEHFMFELGGRVSDWSTVGQIETYKALIDWGFTPRYRLRGGYNRAHRAPNLGELYIARSQIFGSAATVYGDQCSQNHQTGPYSANPAANVEGSAGAQRTEDICRALMGPSGAFEYYDNRPLADQPDGIDGTYVGLPNTTGNPNLREEQADTFTLGVVMGLFDDWQLTVDYYSITLEDMIAVESADDVFKNCFSIETNPTSNPLHSACQQMLRNPNTGGPSNMDVSFTNTGKATVEGVDLQLDWRTSLANGDGLNVNVLANFSLESSTQTAAGQPTIDWAGTRGCALGIQCQGYDYRLFTTVGYSKGPWNLTMRHQYWPSIHHSSYAEGLTGTPNATGNIGSYQLFSLAGAYSFRDRYTVRMGIENLFDKDPPIAGGNPNAVPFPIAPTRVSGATYDPLGRRAYLSMSMNF